MVTLFMKWRDGLTPEEYEGMAIASWKVCPADMHEKKISCTKILTSSENILWEKKTIKVIISRIART